MSSTAASKAITELKVSAHLMTLEAGLFCIFNSPGAPPPDKGTGLPGVRLSEPPAPAGHSGSVSITGFNAGGWLGGGDGAALVRVTGGAAQVLVTVYQDASGQQDAPKLQVIRLNEADVDMPVAAAARTGERPAPDTQDEPPMQAQDIEVAATISGRGDVGGRLGRWMGERGSKRWIEGFGLMPGGGVAASDIEYQAVLGRNWLSPWSEGGQFCGSRGMSLPILGLRVRLRGAAAETHTLSVSASFVDGTEVGPVSDGEACEAPSLAPLEAFQIVLRPIAKTQEAAPVADDAAQSPASPKQGRSRPAAPAAAPKKSARQSAAEALTAPKAQVPARKPGLKAAAAEPAAPATPPKAAKRTSAATRRR